jgi:hypothetical protein
MTSIGAITNISSSDETDEKIRVRNPCKLIETDLRNASVTQTDHNRPLTLTRCQAAEMCGITLPTFDSWVRRGILPPAIPGTRRWSRIAIERRVAGEPTPSAANDNAASPFEEWKRSHAR